MAVDAPGSSRSHRSVVGRYGDDGRVVLCWCQQVPGGPLRVAVTTGAPGAGGPVVLLPVEAARGLAGSLVASAGR